MIKKALEITSAQIQFVSLVDKAANKKRFLITKAEKGYAEFSAYGKIIKTDAENHYITGIVYEPLAEDAHGNYMTETEIIKAAYWFMKNGDSVDLQHSFKALEGAAVVENWVAKADFEIDGEKIKKGTWLMTVEVSDNEVWEAVQKNEITGFSMGGIGEYSEEDTVLSEEEKNKNNTHSAIEKQSIIQKLASMLGIGAVIKGAMQDKYEKRAKISLFWNAFYTLEDILYRYNSFNGEREFENDEALIREALTEFTNIAQSILTNEDKIAKSLAEEISVDKLRTSKEHKAILKSIYNNLSHILSESNDDIFKNEESNFKEDDEVKKSELTQIVDEAIKKALENVEPANDEAATKNTEETITAETLNKMVETAVQKALEIKEEDLTPNAIEKMVTDAVQKAVDPILKSRGFPSNLNDGKEPIEKSGNHYLSGLL